MRRSRTCCVSSRCRSLDGRKRLPWLKIMRMLRRLLPFFLVVLSAAALAQKPADVLAAQIKKETGLGFTYTVPHQKANAKWAVVVLAIKPAEGSEKPKA